ncbi:MAG TPA: polysaccharide deacetylase family protein [Pyrinomonadaceae bacterium]|nr:polysaccharide deacetylase family protein [Pyrinomonadaceae bacterium]
MKQTLMLAVAVLVLLPSLAVRSQQPAKTIAERLGYPRDAKLLIVHADDLGMAHSVNAATIKAFETGLVNSGSIMVPCPWLSEIATYARGNPQADLGLHLTLTSEWTAFRWGPVSSRDRVPSLLDKDGYFRLTETEAAAQADPKQVELEITAQIERARALGIQPTHLDSHMGTLYQNKELFELFLRVARSQKLPVRVAKTWFARADFLPSVLNEDDVYIDRVLDINPTVAPQDWAKFYGDALRKLEPGVTEVVIHLAYDDAEMRAATVNHPDWGAAWRQRDFEFFTSDTFRKLLQENQIKLITWRELGKLIK